MTTTAHEDQFTVAPEPVRQTYSTADILRRNVADLEIALKQQTERAEKAEAELARLLEQKPALYMAFSDCGNFIRYWTRDTKNLEATMSVNDFEVLEFYTAPVPAPAVLAVPDGDDFNGSTPHLIQCMEALVRLDADGVLVPHGIGRDASKLLSAAANRLRQQAASSVPEEWRNIVTKMLGWWDAPVMTMSQGKFIAEKARAMLQSVEVTK